MKKQRETPDFLVDEICDMIEKTIPLDDLYESDYVLEPSAGEGKLMMELANRLAFSRLRRKNFICVELNKEKAARCLELNFETIHGDFLKHDFGNQKFRIIAAAPPFINNIDVEHIQKMYDLLLPDGIIVTLTSPLWMVNNEPHQVAFREFLKNKWYSMKMVPDNTFMEKGKTVPTAILKIEKS
jgi:hypothetical protein